MPYTWPTPHLSSPSHILPSPSLAFSQVHERREHNKMRLKNLTVVFAPNLWLLAPPEPPPSGRGNPLSSKRTSSAAGKHAAAAAAPSTSPLEEMRNVERAEQALHALCSHALRLSRGRQPAGRRVSALL